MTYQITGLSINDFEKLIGASEDDLAAQGAVRVVADADIGWPCRVSLTDAKSGESLILFNYLSHDVATPYRSSYAIFINENSTERAAHIDETPSIFDGRPIAFRAFDSYGFLKDARLALSGQADAKIRDLFDNDDIAYLHAHNAAHGCFVALVERQK
ncbi:MAG: DUF1203 domain-containing protein [Sphingomonadales bacterium]|nr:DUF1203 domain-containing protein [Sphingomonadales bacterium]